MTRLRQILRRLKRHTSGTAATELALALPFMMTASLWGIELANFAVVNMKVSQLAIHVADNASRIGDSSALGARKIYEADINDLLTGMDRQAGANMRLFERGRVIISSLEVNGDDEQYIHWQRCNGTKNWPSSYGAEDDVLTDGMGPDDQEVIAFNDEAVMFVEFVYEYQPLISARFVGEPTIESIASFTVRSDRDLTKIYQRDPSSPDTVAGCETYKDIFS